MTIRSGVRTGLASLLWISSPVLGNEVSEKDRPDAQEVCLRSEYSGELLSALEGGTAVSELDCSGRLRTLSGVLLNERGRVELRATFSDGGRSEVQVVEIAYVKSISEDPYAPVASRKTTLLQFQNGRLVNHPSSDDESELAMKVQNTLGELIFRTFPERASLLTAETKPWLEEFLKLKGMGSHK